MKFDEQQQIFIDALINKRVAQIKSAAEAKAAEVLATAEAVLELKRLLNAAYDKTRITEIKAAAATHGAINPAQVATLLDSTVRIDTTGNLYVVNSQGERCFSKDGAALSVDSAVAGFLSSNPNHVKASVTTGAGSQGNNGFFSGIARVIKRWQYDQLTPQARMERILDGAVVVD